MKKLVIFDHNGQQVWQSDVFVDGQDFTWEADRPTPIWLGSIRLMSEQEFNEMRGIRAIEPLPESQQTKVGEGKEDVVDVSTESGGESGTPAPDSPEESKELPKSDSPKRTPKRAKANKQTKSS